MNPHESIDWYPIVKRYTTRLVHIRSVSPGKGEIQVARVDETERRWKSKRLPVPAAAARPGSYRLPLGAMQRLNLPVVNLGPYGKGAHQPGERVLMSYAFGELPLV